MATKKAAKKAPAKKPVRKRVSDTTARTVRAGGQGTLGYALVDLLDSFQPLTGEQFGALVVIVSIVISFVQNLAENRGWIPAILKTVPPRDEPVLDAA